MAMRLSGLMSGMETDTIVQELVAVRRTKVDKETKAKTKLNWKQDIWKDLNSKLKNLQAKYLNNMRFESTYSKKTTTVSNPNVVSVITGEGAMNGVQSLEIERLAKTCYMTSGKVQYSGSEELSALSKLSDIGVTTEGQFEINVTTGMTFDEASNTLTGGDTRTFRFTKDSTISDVLNKLKDAGLNANFDAEQKRFYISAKESGGESNFKIESADADVMTALGFDDANAVKTTGVNAKIYLNDAIYESSTNVFDINGLTFTALSTTAAGQSVTVTTQNDVNGVYDMVKNFLKEYNSIINEIDKLYNADSAKGYEPLTDDEKDSMSDSEIEKYESKIKDALLRRDTNLSTIRSSLSETMMSGIDVKVNGVTKTMYLNSFGIETLGYFEAAENEKNAYHIFGDPDDADTSGKPDKLKTMISNDPDTVIAFFSQLSKNLYAKMDDLSSPIEGYRSFGTFYDDKKMKSDYDDYTSKIEDLEKKLADYEDKWYAKFAAMETAMAKMQSNASAVTSLLGGS